MKRTVHVYRILGAVAAALALVMLVFSSLAQTTQETPESCTALVERALQSTDAQCSGITRNQACYGHQFNEVVSMPGVKRIQFDAQGDRVGLNQMQSLRMSGLDVEQNVWGIVLMQAQANLPDVLPGQNVTFVLFGDVEVDNAIGAGQERIAAVTDVTVLRSFPAADSKAAALLIAGSKLLANGKTVTPDGVLWVRGGLTEDRGVQGWLPADRVSVDLLLLPDVSPDTPAPRPLQAFYLRTGIGAPTCAEAPPDGILVQSPAGAGKVSFTVNGIDVALGSTGFITSRDDIQSTCVSLITGDADVQTGRGTVNLDPGERTCVEAAPDDGAGPGAPSEPELYDSNEIERVIPLLDLLPNPVDEMPVVPTYTPTPTATNTPRPTLVPPTRTATLTSTPTVTDPPPAANTPVPPTAIPPTRVKPSAEPCTPEPIGRVACVTMTPLPTETPIPDTPTNTPIPDTPTNTPVPPSITIEYSLSVFTASLSVLNSGGPIDTYSWDLGDSNTSAAAAPAHTYATGGTFNVSVTVGNAGGTASASTTVVIPACNLDPTIPAQISFQRDATDLSTTLYEIFFKDENCVPSVNPIAALSLSTLTAGPFASEAGRHWFVVRTDGTPTLWDEFVIPSSGGTFNRFLTDGV